MALAETWVSAASIPSNTASTSRRSEVGDPDELAAGFLIAGIDSRHHRLNGRPELGRKDKRRRVNHDACEGGRDRRLAARQ